MGTTLSNKANMRGPASFILLAVAVATGHPHNVGVLTGVGYSGYSHAYYGKREAEADAYTIGQVAYGGARGVITGVDYGYGAVSGYGAIGNRAIAYAATPAVAAVPAVSYTSPVVSKVSAPAVVSTYNTAPAVVSTYNTAPYNSYAHTNLGYSGILGYNRHFIAKREAESDAEAYTPAQVALGQTNGGVITGVDYGY